MSEPQEEWRQGIELAELFRNGKGRTGETASRSSAAGWPRRLVLDGGEVTTGLVSLLAGKGGIATAVRTHQYSPLGF